MTHEPRRSVASGGDGRSLVEREWLVTNGLGGYASSTIAGVVTRRYHGHLIAALANPRGRMVMLDELSERVRDRSGGTCSLGGEDPDGGIACADLLESFELELGLPVWRFRVGRSLLERRVLMPHRQNTVYVRYSLLEGDPLRLELEPAVHFRDLDAPVTTTIAERYAIAAQEDHFTIAAAGLPPLRLVLHARDARFELDRRSTGEITYVIEQRRGYEHRGALWVPGRFVADLEPGAGACFVASTEPPEIMSAIAPHEVAGLERERRSRLLSRAGDAAGDDVGSRLVLAADQFVITPAGRAADRMRLLAQGDEVRSVIAGYHWFSEWGRDTMISLEGLTLCTGRYREAASIIRTFAHYVRDGLIPNLFPDGSNEGLYHTADATLWAFHAIDRYVSRTGDAPMISRLLPVLHGVIDAHVRGTRFGIGIDPRDALLRQGADGYPLTWMDAKVGDWVVTPRRGKAVEVNALWCNALALMARWVRDEEGGRAARPLEDLCGHVRASFNDRFWCEEKGHLYDVVDGPEGDDARCRPNQLLALSLPNPVLDRARWRPVLDVVRRKLLTPYGLRTLAPGEPDYAPRYDGDLRARDAAYHQGTVWPWLIGAYVDAVLRVDGDARAARAALEPLARHLDDFGVGSIAEIFDAEPPYTPRGCVAQAWSVAEMLRAWLATEESGLAPAAVSVPDRAPRASPA
ncbi:MAG TPA: amylo-alpha-1,6-glucosidase [Candidatus Limnocylindria bacterium]|nr:amylo-alpha-1,6-glucosidase [Candidatus Limnocylindria bacterium]